MNIVNTQQTVENYPYGRLRCTAFFSVEFDPKKGFRSVFQTINPKNGRLNAPKKSTYSDLVIMQNNDGFVTNMHFSMNGIKEMNKAAKVIAENFDLFTPAQIEYLYLNFISMSKVSMYAYRTYSNITLEQMKPFFDAAVNAAIEGARSKGIINVFDKITFDYDGLEALKNPNYQPFKVVSTFTL